MAACRFPLLCSWSLISRLDFNAWNTAGICVKSQDFICFQSYKFFHGLGGVLVMDARKGKQPDTDGRKRRNAVQTWRAVSSQPFYEGDREGGTIQDTNRRECSVSEDSRPPEKHSISVEVGWSLMRFIKGKGGATQEEIEFENGVQIKFPLSKNEDVIIIEGSSIDSVAKASEKVQSIINKAVNSREFDYTHFVSLPLAIHPGLVDKLFAFQNRILGVTGSNTSAKAENKDAHIQLKSEHTDSHLKLVSYPSKGPKATVTEASSSAFRGVDKSIFIKPKTFHLTVLMLKLWNKERVNAAAEVLQSISSKVLEALENRPISIRLKGLDCMKGSLAKARVLYAPVEDIGGEGRLLKACQVIIDAYAAAGLIVEMDAQHKLKLHATLMNSSHRKRSQGGRNMDYFDAREIFEMYGSEEWGDYQICEAHLSQMFVFDNNGYYHCCASVPFPNGN